MAPCVLFETRGVGLSFAPDSPEDRLRLGSRHSVGREFAAAAHFVKGTPDAVARSVLL